MEGKERSLKRGGDVWRGKRRRNKGRRGKGRERDGAEMTVCFICFGGRDRRLCLPLCLYSYELIHVKFFRDADMRHSLVF